MDSEDATNADIWVVFAVILLCIVAVIGCYLCKNRCYFANDAQKSRLIVNEL